MSVFIVFALAFVLAVAAKKRWIPGQHWLLQYHRSKKYESDNGDGRVEIVVDNAAGTQPTSRIAASGKTANSSNLSNFVAKVGARKPVITKQPRYEGAASASSGSAEGAIRSALNDLRSRQVVKNLCSQFEARVARKSVAPIDDDEEACIRAATSTDGDDEYLVPAQNQQQRQEEPRIAPAPYGPRRSSSSSISDRNASNTSASAAKANNLHMFLRQYSSNLDKANSPCTSPTAANSSSSNSSDPRGVRTEPVVAAPAPIQPIAPVAPVAPVASNAILPPNKPIQPIAPVASVVSLPVPVASTNAPAIAPVAETSVAAPVAAPTSASVTAPTPITSGSLLQEIDLLDLQAHAADDEVSNQCDSPPRLEPAAQLSDVVEQHEPAALLDSIDKDAVLANQQLQASPEEASVLEDKAPRAPVVASNVGRFQQFQLQIPSNHARLAASSSRPPLSPLSSALSAN